VTDPDVSPVKVTEQAFFARVHLFSASLTAPVPAVDHATVPVGRYPETLAVQVTTVEEPATTGDGTQVRTMLEVFLVTRSE